MIRKIWVVLIVLFVSTFNESCNDCKDCHPEKFNCIQIIKNSSPHSVELTLYEKLTPIKEYNINTGDSLKLEYSRKEDSGCIPFQGNTKIDSVVFTFNDNKKYTHYKCKDTAPCMSSLNSNVLDGASYEVNAGDPKNIKSVFTITLEAYNKAK